MNILRHIIRGCGTLPHVAEHPGTVPMVAFLMMGAMAGSKAGLKGCLFGVVMMAIFFGPLYLYGAYDRSKYSERRELQERQKANDS